MVRVYFLEILTQATLLTTLFLLIFLPRRCRGGRGPPRGWAGATGPPRTAGGGGVAVRPNDRMAHVRVEKAVRTEPREEDRDHTAAQWRVFDDVKAQATTCVL